MSLKSPGFLSAASSGAVTGVTSDSQSVSGPTAGTVGLSSFYPPPGTSSFEKLLSINGVVLNGTTDDAPGIQAALNTAGSSGKIYRIAFPPGGFTAAIGSVNTCSFADALASSSPPNCGIVVPSNLGIDWNGLTLSVNAAGLTAIGTSGTVVGFAGNSVIATGTAYPCHMLTQQSLTILGGGVGWAAWLANSTADHGPDRVTFRNVRMVQALSGVFLGDRSYLNGFYDSYFSCASAANPCVNISNNLGGENYHFHGCLFAPEAAGNGACFGIVANTASDTYCYGCSFDFLETAVNTNAGAGPQILVELHGCHMEFNTSSANWNSTSGYLRISNNAGANQAINMFGGSIVQDASGSGTQLPYFARAGTTGASLPYGITLNKVQRVLQAGTLIGNTSDTGAFVDAL